MRVALVTPFSADSTMGEFAASILPHLSERHDVEVWCPQTGKALEADVPVIAFEPVQALGDPRLDDYDIVVYQMGNDPQHFLPILQLSGHIPGVIIQHDYAMHQTLSFYYLSVLRQPVAYLSLVERAYGRAARKHAEQSLIGRAKGLWEAETLPDYPLFEPLLANQLGVVVHSDFFLNKVRRVFAGPSTAIPLALHPLPESPKISRAELGIPADRLLILSTGYMNRAKLLDVTIRALGRSPELARRVLFAIVGQESPDEAPALRALAEELHLKESVRFVGFQPKSVLHAWIQNADICVNLRNPNTEGASLSVLEQMQHGKPVVVLPTGSYAELPSDAVIRCEPDDLENLHSLLLRLVNDEQWRARVGAAARQFVSVGFHPSDYADRLASFIVEAHAHKPLSALRRNVASELSRIGRAAEVVIGDSVRRQLEQTLGGSGRGDA